MGPLQRALRVAILGLSLALIGFRPRADHPVDWFKPGETDCQLVPAGVESTKVAVATSPDLDAFGEFPLLATVISDFGTGSTQTSWTADEVLPNGTYYVHVEGKEGPVFAWSSVQALVVNDAAIASVLSSAGSIDGKATATWSLPPDVEVVTIEVASSPSTTGTGNFETGNIVDLKTFLGSTKTTWTSARELDTGTYYLHVGTRHTNCLLRPTRSWSNVKSFVLTSSGGSGTGGGSGGGGGSNGAGLPPSPTRGRVIRIIDGGAFVVRLASGKKGRIELLGVDAPGFRPRECFSRKAKKELRRLVLDRNVIIRLDSTQVTRTSQGRLLAYANRPGRFDVGKRMIALGAAEIIQPKKGFKRHKAYRRAEKKAERLDRGLWRFCNNEA